MSLIASLVAGVAFLGQGSLGEPIKWRTFAAGSQSAAVKQEIVVMDTAGDYQSYIRNLVPDGAPSGRDIDWNKEHLVAIHTGQRSSGGYGVDVDSISRINPREAQVRWTERTPMRGSMNSQALTSPWVIVRINRFGGKLTFSGSKKEATLPGGIKVISGGNGGSACGCCSACGTHTRNLLPYRIYDGGIDSPVVLPTNFVMSSQSDWDRYVQNFQMKRLGDGSDIDWYRDRLVAIHSGRKLTGGYELVVGNVKVLNPRQVEITVYEIQPSSTLNGWREATGPYLIIRIPRVGSVVTVAKKPLTYGLPIPFDNCCSCGSCRCS